MKTAISIDKKLFDEAEGFSRSVGLSRSRLYCTAINEYLQNHSTDVVCEKYNEYYGSHKSELDKDIKAANYRLFSKEDW